MAKLLGLGYPGGPVIDRLAKGGNDRAWSFPVARMTHPDRNAAAAKGQLDFSFSGLKTAVLRHVRGARATAGRPADAGVAGHLREFPARGRRGALDKTFAAARWYGARSVGIAGGVSANSRLRADAAARRRRAGVPVFVPTSALSTDNAAMIAAAGLRRFHAGVRAGSDLNAEASLPLEAAAVGGLKVGPEVFRPGVSASGEP